MSFDDNGLELKGSLHSFSARPARQISEADVVEVVHARLWESEPGLLKVGREVEEDVLGDALEANLGLNLGARADIEGKLGGEAVLVETLDGKLLEVEGGVEVEAKVDRFERGERLEDRRPSLSELGGRVDDDSDLEDGAILVRTNEGAVERSRSQPSSS